jgi:acetylglutamate kinase
VYKVGGPALEDPRLVTPLADEIRRYGGDVVLVHGGGRQVERMLRQLGIESRFVEGRRETTPAAMEVVEMVLTGSMNQALAAGLSSAGLPAVGISGRDGGLLRARLVEGLGHVGTPSEVNPAVIEGLWAASFVPVVSPVSCGPNGEAVNVNADEAAAAIARAVEAPTLVFLSDVDGVVLDGAAVERLDESKIAARTADGSISGGMAMKVRMALAAARHGIDEVVIAGRARLSGGFPGTRVSIRS